MAVQDTAVVTPQQPTTSRARAPLSGLQHAAIGSASGIFEVCCQQPLLSIKNCIQQNQPISFRPSVLYRGVGIMCASIAPVSGVQFAVDGMLSSYLQRHHASPPASSDTSRIATASFAGVCSSLLSSPAELVMTLQQRTGHTMVQTTRVRLCSSLSLSHSNVTFETKSVLFLTLSQEVVHSFGITRLYKALPLTMARETVWCASFLALGPEFGKKLHAQFPVVFGSLHDASLSQLTAASLAGSVGAGLVAVLATQPVDTIKTILQGKALDKTPSHTLTELQALWRQGGLLHLYKGTVPRGLRLIGAVFILSETKKALENQVYKFQEDYRPAAFL
ncbi:hypothetical protein DYB36_011902 [Aphanomyces astaci]|uniref:Uncharacterized protein n=1 Tax=Aphanomyces astaci TaxID=112090 RepID=A0A397A8T4_APHAT|nr:hypothetical protein DYB36_011902 [Aphanomyces astaci]